MLILAKAIFVYAVLYFGVAIPIELLAGESVGFFAYWAYGWLCALVALLVATRSER